MKQINLSITGCLGRMGQQLIKSTKNTKNFRLVSVTENKIINKKISGLKPQLNSESAFKNANMSPVLKKVVINMGLGLDGNDSKIVKSCQEDLAKITGQKPVITKFKKSISNFKTRKNTNAGLKVTIRRNLMYEFIDRLINVALPRIKDFRGLSQMGLINLEIIP